MKNYCLIILLLLLVLGMAGCGQDAPATEAAQTVEVTIPRAIVGDQSDEEIVANAETEGLTVTIGDDDTVTYRMTPEQQQELLLGFKTHFEERLQEAMDAGELPGVVSVSYNDAMSVFTVTVNEDQGDAAAWGLLYSTGTAYQLYAGTPDEEIDVAVTLIDQDTQAEVDTFTMREVFSAQHAESDAAD